MGKYTKKQEYQDLIREIGCRIQVQGLNKDADPNDTAYEKNAAILFAAYSQKDIGEGLIFAGRLEELADKACVRCHGCGALDCKPVGFVVDSFKPCQCAVEAEQKQIAERKKSASPARPSLTKEEIDKQRIAHIKSDLRQIASIPKDKLTRDLVKKSARLEKLLRRLTFIYGDVRPVEDAPVVTFKESK